MASATSFRQILGISPSTASPSDSTLIIIDAQNEYADGKLVVSDVKSTSAAIAGSSQAFPIDSDILTQFLTDLLKTYRASGTDNIIHVKHQVPAGAPVFTPDTPLAEIMDVVAPKQGEKVITKQHPGSFTGTDLEQYLEAIPGGKGKKVVLTGYMAREYPVAHL